MAKKSRNQARLAKHQKIRTHLKGTSQMPRISIFRSHRNFSVQVIDDTKGFTLASVSTAKKDSKEYAGNILSAQKLAKELATKMHQAAIQKVVFDRSGYLYHGRVKAFANALREEGIQF